MYVYNMYTYIYIYIYAGARTQAVQLGAQWHQGTKVLALLVQVLSLLGDSGPNMVHALLGDSGADMGRDTKRHGSVDYQR
jgi:hypothetical protein